MADRNKEIFNSRSTHYNDDVDASVSFSGLKANFFTKTKAEYFLEYIRKDIGDPRDLDVLDLGCGIGVFEGLFHNTFKKLSGIDVSSSSLEIAKKSCENAEFFLYDGGGLPFADNSFDVVFTICVMHHVPPENWKKFLQEAKRVTKPGGTFAVFEHNPFNLLTRHVVNNCVLDEDAVLLNPYKLRRLGSQIFNSSPKLEFILLVPPLNTVLKFLDRFFKVLPLGAQYVLYFKSVERSG